MMICAIIFAIVCLLGEKGVTILMSAGAIVIAAIYSAASYIVSKVKKVF